jgi:single-strand DNA-binding protein
MARSLNKVTLIGNLTRDPELRYTPQGTAVATFSIATNRQWKTESGEQKEDAEFHRIVAWDKLAEICSQLLKRGSKAYVEGRLQTRKWQTKDGQERTTTEIVISEMMILDKLGESGAAREPEIDVPEDFGESEVSQVEPKESPKKPKKNEKKVEPEADDDIPF